MADLKQRILDALSQVDDPDLKRDIVSLGMVQDLKIADSRVSFKLVLTTPACPFKDVLRNACQTAIHHMVDKDLDVDIDFASVVTTQRRENASIMGGVKNLVAVASGKGGVGKSSVAVNLAIAMAQTGARVGLVDADIYGPSLPVLLGLTNHRPQVVQKEGGKLSIVPFEVHGIKTMSVGWLIEERQALAWRGPMITTALRQLLTDVEWGQLDYLFVDMPPGTDDIYLTLAQNFPLSAVVVVTTPHRVAVADTRKSIEMFRMPAINVPVLGIVENMAWFSPPEKPQEKHYVFGTGGADALAADYDIEVLARLPLMPMPEEERKETEEMPQSGTPAFWGDDPLLKREFVHLAEKVAQHISIINNKGPGEETA